MKTVWMVDCDGVLSRWNQGMVRLLESTTGRKSIVDSDSDAWVKQWSWHELAGFTKEEWILAWEQINVTPSWWATLQPYPHARRTLEALRFREMVGDEVYFVTSRVPSLSKWYTTEWLSAHGFENASVILASDEAHKGHIAVSIRADVVIDDKPSNLESVRAIRSIADLWLVDRPWNTKAPVASGIKRTWEEMVPDRIQIRRRAKAA